MKLFHAKYAQMRHGYVSIQEDDFYLPDQHAVRRHLRSNGFFPVDIREQRQSLLEWADVRSRGWQIQLLRALRFQGATASAGTALLNIIEGESDPKRRLAFLPTRTVLKGGGSFSEALKALRLFDAATMAIITAGERAGDLKGVIQHAIEHTEEKGKQTKVIITALSWLSFDIVNIVGTIWGAQFGFIPYLKNQGAKTSDAAAVEKFDHAIAVASRINMALLVLVTTIVIGGMVFVALYWFNRQQPDHYTSKILMKMPIMSSYLRNSSIKESCKLMQRLLNGKVPLADALDIIIESVNEPSCRLYWTECKGRVMAGAEPSRALARWPLTKGEQDQVRTIQSVSQLAEVYAAIAEERGLMAKTDQRRLAISGVILMMVLAGATILTMVYLLVIQNQSFLDSLTELRS
ncbi:MAG: type II secretion system F family protein [Alphaproteobacteria bacterium]|nr:type II secretion system F family protein [Alphaproteobacteria bacterium]